MALAPPASLRRRLPSLLVELLRRGRSAALWALGPVDRSWRLLTGRGDLPPLWLRRHVGPVGRFESAARETAELIARLGLVGEGSRVVDLGCGCGAMVPALAARIGEAGSYLGIDVHRPSLGWCRRRWGGDPRLRFERAAVRSPYGSGGGGAAAEVRLPAGDGEADFVLAKSLFTHLLEEEARAYLGEVRRMLAPGGAALATLFLFDGDRFAAAPPPAFPHPGPGSPVRWRRAARPHAAVAYERRWWRARLEEAGLAVEVEVPGYFPGEAAVPAGQDVLVLRRTD
ncbi:MAG TPA: class I SAM-dependent methyltransferase [Thermoanaerobaculia bacterium]